MAAGITAVVGILLIAGELGFWLLTAFETALTEARTAFLPIAIFVASVTLVLWPVRILSRMLLSNLHLRTDAELRATMANTYLSLLRDDAVPMADNDRELILNVLFRPVATGLVKDDAMPNTPIEVISRQFTK